MKSRNVRIKTWTLKTSSGLYYVAKDSLNIATYTHYWNHLIKSPITIHCLINYIVTKF